MKNIALITMLLFGLMLVCSNGICQEQKVVFDFEKGLQGWEIPDWAYEKDDHVAEEVTVSSDYASSGEHSMAIKANFPGEIWSASVVEVMQYFDWKDYGFIAADFYLPETAPKGLKAKIILTIGDSWKWVEQSRGFKLEPGKWTTITADIKPGSIDWRRTEVDDAFRRDVRKIDLRIESNRKPVYDGYIYVDNIRVLK